MPKPAAWPMGASSDWLLRLPFVVTSAQAGPRPSCLTACHTDYLLNVFPKAWPLKPAPCSTPSPGIGKATGLESG